MQPLLISNLKTVLFMSAKSVYISASKFLKESSDTYAIKGILVLITYESYLKSEIKCRLKMGIFFYYEIREK